MSDGELVPWTAAWLKEYERRKPSLSNRIGRIRLDRVRWKRLYDRQKGFCPWCGFAMKLNEASIEHIIPKSKGGDSSFANLALAHKKCNNDRRSNTGLQPVERPEFYFIRARLDAYEVRE